MFSVLSFAFLWFLVAFVSPASAACYAFYNDFYCPGGAGRCTICPSALNGYNGSYTVTGKWQISGPSGCGLEGGTNDGYITLSCSGSYGYFAITGSTYYRSCAGANYSAYARTTGYKCDTKCEADSISCIPPNGWDSQSCTCNPPLPPPPDFTWHCQNSGGPAPGGFGAPPTADLYRCENKSGESVQSCVLKRKLHGTCQDWGFCKDGVDDCHIDPEKGDPPCGRSGEPFTTSPRCYYACADGTDLSCKPVSTQYVAGAIYKGECPGDPPEGCRPASSSSGSSSSGVAVSSSSYGTPPDDWRDTVPNSPGGSQPPTIDYTRILAAIHDTLHRANEQREFLMELDNNISFDVDNISNYTEYIYNQESAISTGVSGINSKLTSLQDNGFSLVSETAQDISNSRQLLDEINSYLRSDSLYSHEPDTVYNPLLRDIKGAIDSINVNVALDSGSNLFSRDSAFSRWWSNYMADTAQSNGVVGKLYDDVKRAVGDSTKNASCARFMACYSSEPTFANSQACAASVGVTLEQCTSGGSPLDASMNVGEGILKTLWDAIFGEDSTVIDTASNLDTSVVFGPKKDTAEGWLNSAISSLFSPESTEAILQRVERLKDSVERAKNDTVKVQPDSLWLDSSEAAGYVQNMLLPPGTVNECWVCHAELGTFGGLVSNGLSIHVDFGNFGGFDFCAIIRAVVKIASFVVCMSLTLGSWMAAFGYNPKNDA